MEDSDFIIFLDEIPAKGLVRSLVVEDARAAGIDLAAPQGGPLRVEARLSRHGEKVLVRGSLEVPVLQDCSRCLGRFSLEVKNGLETYLEDRGDSPSETDGELSPEELDIRPLQKGVVDLRPLIAEQVHLGLPVKALCSEECRGLCPSCGKDLNRQECGCDRERGDPRWEALKKLSL